MDAKEFLKCFIRYCNNTSCDDCVMIGDGCYPGAITDIDRLIDKVEQWLKDHPVKTRQSEFLKRFPNADLTRLQPCMIEKDKRPMWCGKYADFGANGCCDECRYAYWNEEVDN